MKGRVSVVLGLAVCAGLGTGSDAWAQQPPPPAPPPPTVIIIGPQPRAPTMKSPGLVIGGGVLVGLGGVMLLVGIPITIWGADVANSCVFQYTAGGYACTGTGSKGPLAGGIVTTLLGAGMVAGGAVMLAIGLEDPEPAPGAAAERNPLVPTLQLGATSAQLEWAF